MGNSQNLTLPQEGVNKLVKETDIKQKEIKKIHKKFIALDRDKKGYVTDDDISKIPEIEKNPLRFYICQNLKSKKDANQKDNEVNFEEFVKLIDIFKNNKQKEQYRFVYDLLDFNKDGKICYEDLLVNLKLLLGNSLNDEQVKEIVEKTIVEYSGDQKYITYDEFAKIIDS